MRGLWERFKRFYNGQDRIDWMNREFEQRMEWHREDIERARKQARAELRDEFAKAALIGLLAFFAKPLPRPIDAAKWAYEYADAMLEARDAGKDEK